MDFDLEALFECDVELDFAVGCAAVSAAGVETDSPKNSPVTVKVFNKSLIIQPLARLTVLRRRI